MTVRTDEPRSVSGAPQPETGRDAPLPGLAPPDGVNAISGLTAAQRQRLRKKIRSAQRKDCDAAYVRCEQCGWTGFDRRLPHDPMVTPCQECGHEFARFAAPPPEDDRWW